MDREQRRATSPHRPLVAGRARGPLPTESERRGAGRRADGGFTLVEVLVAVLLLSLVIGSLAFVFNNALKTGSDSNHRAQAAVVLSSQLARAQSAPYDQVGFYQGQCPSGCPANTVILTSNCTSSCNSGRFVPSQSILNGITFNVDTSITWADAEEPSGTLSQAYKLVEVTVNWKFAGQQESRSSSTIVYPGDLGPYTGPGGSVTTTTFPGPLLEVTNLTPTVPSDPTASWQEIDLTWALPSTIPPNYVVEWATDPSKLPSPGAAGSGPAPQAPGMSLLQYGTSTGYQVQGLTASTTYWFEVVSLSSTGYVVSNQKSATTTAPPASSCTWSSFSVTGDSSGKIYLDSSNVTDTAIALVANSNTNCSGVTVTTTVSPLNPTPSYVLTGSNGVWTGSVPQGQAWSPGTYTVELLVNGAKIAPPVTQSLLVCATPNNQHSKNTGKNC